MIPPPSGVSRPGGAGYGAAGPVARRAPAGGALSKRGNGILANAQVYLCADAERITDGTAYDLFACLAALAGNAGGYLDSLRQYGVQSLRVAGVLPTDRARRWSTLAPDPSSLAVYLTATPHDFDQPNFVYGVDWCAFHDVDAHGQPYAIVALPDPAGRCVKQGWTPFQSLTSTASHELTEALTDTPPGQGWVDAGGEESDDFPPCLWDGVEVTDASGETFTVQTHWRNDTGACWVPDSTIPGGGHEQQQQSGVVSRYGIDVSNYSGTPSADALREIANSEDVGRIIIAAQFEETFTAWYNVAVEVDFEIHAYLYLYNTGKGSYEQQLDAIAPWIQGKNLTGLWLDVEDPNGPYPTAVQLSQAVAHARTLVPCKVGTYTGKWYWLDYLGNPQLGSECLLWLGDWSQEEPYNFAVAFGGWDRAAVLQVKGDFQSYGVLAGFDVWDD